jgi:hypothetical protein
LSALIGLEKDNRSESPRPQLRERVLSFLAASASPAFFPENFCILQTHPVCTALLAIADPREDFVTVVAKYGFHVPPITVNHQTPG